MQTALTLPAAKKPAPSSRITVVALYDTLSQTKTAVKELQEGEVQHEQGVCRSQGLSHGSERGRVLQHRRPNEVLAGPLVSQTVDALAKSAVCGGLSVVRGALYGIGIPQNTGLDHEAGIRTGKYLLSVHGTAVEATCARNIISATGASEFELYCRAERSMDRNLQRR